jgi:ubiquinone/menaquinone biosynthesis C-methylase UbiE
MMAAMSTSTSPTESFQLSIEAAEAYEADFVPAFFAQWAPALCAAAGIAPGHQVLDVACGTGIVARHAADITGPANVTGVDLNDAMLTVARRLRPDIDWRQGDVATLPFDDRSFDTVLCQMALMFFADRTAAIGEMTRVATDGGSVAVLVPASLAEQPAYGSLIDVLAGHVGPEARSLLSTYFDAGDLDQLVARFAAFGLEATTSRSELGAARFPSADAAVATEVNSTPLGDHITPETYEAIVTDARQLLAPYAATGGSLEIPFLSHIVTGRRP